MKHSMTESKTIMQTSEDSVPATCYVLTPTRREEREKVVILLQCSHLNEWGGAREGSFTTMFPPQRGGEEREKVVILQCSNLNEGGGAREGSYAKIVHPQRGRRSERS